MKVTSDINNNINIRIKQIILTFMDDGEVTLNQIVSYDFDMDKIELSNFEITNAFMNVELLNRFKTNENDKMSIKHIHIQYEVCGYTDPEKKNDMYMDIPTNYMCLRRVRLEQDCNSCANMFIELEGEIY